MQATPLARVIMGAIVGTFFVACLAGLSALFAALLRLVWNAIAPTFHLPSLSFGVAWALWILMCLVGGVLRGSSTKS